MSTIKTLASDRTISTEPSAEGSNALFLRTNQDLYKGMGVHIYHKDLIEIVEKEIGGIFIKDSDLPEVMTYALSNPPTFKVGGSFFSMTDEEPDALENVAKRYLVAARHIRANQPSPIDQEQVEAFVNAFEDVDLDASNIELAAEFVKAGYKITKEV